MKSIVEITKTIKPKKVEFNLAIEAPGYLSKEVIMFTVLRALLILMDILQQDIILRSKDGKGRKIGITGKKLEDMIGLFGCTASLILKMKYQKTRLIYLEK